MEINKKTKNKRTIESQSADEKLRKEKSQEKNVNKSRPELISALPPAEAHNFDHSFKQSAEKENQQPLPKKSQQFPSAKTKIPNTDIAIIGMACRFPGANNYNEFWENLKNGVNSIKEIPPERWDINKYYSPDINEPNKSISKWCGLVDDFDKFDNEFFNISPREAEHMDPQQRLLLEEAWLCIEDSGVSLKRLQEKKRPGSKGYISG
jgi:hypothetical protein